jgi:acyl-CoA-binding protein
MAITLNAFALGPGTPGPSRATDPYADDAPLWKAAQLGNQAAQQQQNSAQQFQDTMARVGAWVPDFVRKLDEQEALTYKIDKRNKMMVEGTKAVADWEPTATGVNALGAPKALGERLTAIKDELLKDAPSDLARKHASQDLDTHIASFQVHGEKVARKGFRDYSVNATGEWEDRLLSIAATSGGNPATQQWVLDTGKAAWVAQGASGLVISPEEADRFATAFEKKAAMAYVQGQLTNPQLQNKAISEINRGDFKDVLDWKDQVNLNKQVEHIRKQQQADAERAQARARHSLADAQDKLAFSMWEDVKGKSPDEARATYDLQTISALVDAGKLRPAQATHLFDLAQNRVKQSDPAILDEARRMAAGVLTGDAKPEDLKTFMLNNERHLSGNDYLGLTVTTGRYFEQDVDTRSALKQIETVFGTRGAKLDARSDPAFAAEIADSKVRAEDYIVKRRKEGAPAELALAEAQLRYDPALNWKPNSKYVIGIPEDPAEVTGAYKSLYEDLTAGRLDKNDYVKQYKTLTNVFTTSRDRRDLRAQINSYSKVGK